MKNSEREIVKWKNLTKFQLQFYAPISFGATSATKTLSLTRFGLTVVAETASVGCGVAKGTNLASEFSKNKNKYYLEGYTLSNNTVQDFWYMHQKSLDDNKIDQAEWKKILIWITNMLALSSARYPNKLKSNKRKLTFLCQFFQYQSIWC